MNDAELMSALIVGVIVAFYLMFWRPDQKARERHKQQIRDLRPGDEVLTTSGFVARIKDIQVPASGETRLALEMADGVVFTAVPSAILQRLSSNDGKSRSPTAVTGNSNSREPVNLTPSVPFSVHGEGDRGGEVQVPPSSSTGSRPGESPTETGRTVDEDASGGPGQNETRQPS